MPWLRDMMLEAIHVEYFISAAATLARSVEMTATSAKLDNVGILIFALLYYVIYP